MKMAQSATFASVRVSRGLFRQSQSQVLTQQGDFLRVGQNFKLRKANLLCQRVLSPFRLELTYLSPSGESLETKVLFFQDARSCSDWFIEVSQILGDHSALKPLLVFVNPYGGNRTGRLVWKYRVEPLFKAADRKFERIYTKHGNHITQYCALLNLDEYSGVVVVGGDGSIAEAVNGLSTHPDHRARNFPIGLIPAGSSNALAKARGLLEPKVAAFHIIKGNSRPLDAVRVTAVSGPMEDRSSHLSESPGLDVDGGIGEKSFLSICAVSLGFLSEVNSLAKDAIWRKAFGPARYGICGLRRVLFGGSLAKYQAEVRFRRREKEIQEDDMTQGATWERIEKAEASWDVISPELWSRGERQNKLAGEGLVLVTHVNSFRLLKFFSKFSSSQLHEALGAKYKIYRDIDAVEISTTGNTLNLPFSIDGELHSFAKVRLELLKDAVKIFGPPSPVEDENLSTVAPVSDVKERTAQESVLSEVGGRSLTQRI